MRLRSKQNDTRIMISLMKIGKANSCGYIDDRTWQYSCLAMSFLSVNSRPANKVNTVHMTKGSMHWFALTHCGHCGLVTPYSDIYLDQHLLWRHQAITLANIDLSSLQSNDNHLGAIILGIPQPWIDKIILKIIFQFYIQFSQGALSW